MFPARIHQGIERREGARRQQRQIHSDGGLLCCEQLVRMAYTESIEGNSSFRELACLRCTSRTVRWTYQAPGNDIDDVNKYYVSRAHLRTI
jgi:hypothetical protein